MTARKLPSSSNARSLALVLRESLRELGYTCEYRIGQRHFSRFTFVITLDRFARTFRFKVSHPARFDIECWDESPGHGGQLHFLEVSRFDGGSRREVTRLLRLLAVSLPRLPWKFKFTHRLGVGYLLPEFLKARKAWAAMGVTPDDLKGLVPVEMTMGELEEASRSLDEGPLDEDLETDEDEEDDEVEEEVERDAEDDDNDFRDEKELKKGGEPEVDEVEGAEDNKNGDGQPDPAGGD